MTLRYVEITQKDLQREFHHARLPPRHLVPLPACQAPPEPDRPDSSAVLDRLASSTHLLDLFRQQNPAPDNTLLLLLIRRLRRVSSAFVKLTQPAKTKE